MLTDEFPRPSWHPPENSSYIICEREFLPRNQWNAVLASSLYFISSVTLFAKSNDCTIDAVSTGCWSKRAFLPFLEYHPFCPIGSKNLFSKVVLIRKSKLSSATRLYSPLLVERYALIRDSGSLEFEYVIVSSNQCHPFDEVFLYNSISMFASSMMIDCISSDSLFLFIKWRPLIANAMARGDLKSLIFSKESKIIVLASFLIFSGTDWMEFKNPREYIALPVESSLISLTLWFLSKSTKLMKTPFPLYTFFMKLK